MLLPEDVGICAICGCVLDRGRSGGMLGAHRSRQECDEAKSLREYVREYGQEQYGRGYGEGVEAQREPQGDRG